MGHKFRPRTHIEVGEQIRQPLAQLLQQTQLQQVRMSRAPYETKLDSNNVIFVTVLQFIHLVITGFP